MGILNNLIVADTLWLHHIVQRPAQVASLNGIRLLPKPEALDQVLVTELANWHARRTMLNQAIESLMK